MKIKCLSNVGSSLPEDCLEPRVNLDKTTIFSLAIGKEYVVYGMTVYRNYIWYYISDEKGLDYPFWYASPLFEVTDNRLSSYWRYGYFPGVSSNLTYPILSFEEWAMDKYFYDRLTDGVEKDVYIFKSYKQLMDEEF